MRRIARLRRRVRRHGKKSTGTAYVISSLPLEQLDARGVLQLKRGYGVIESKLHHALDVSLAVDRSRVRHPKAALVPGLFRRPGDQRGQCRYRPGADQKTRWSVQRYQQQFGHREGGPERLRALAFTKDSAAWKLCPMKRGALFLGRILQLFPIFC